MVRRATAAELLRRALVPLGIQMLTELQSTQSLDYTSFVLAALTAGGGIMGYAKTRSLPSIIAGCSVGALCTIPTPRETILRQGLTTCSRWPWRISHPEPASLRRRALPPRLDCSRWFLDPSRHQVKEACAYRPQHPVHIWHADLWKCCSQESVNSSRSVLIVPKMWMHSLVHIAVAMVIVSLAVARKNRTWLFRGDAHSFPITSASRSFCIIYIHSYTLPQYHIYASHRGIGLSRSISLGRLFTGPAPSAAP